MRNALTLGGIVYATMALFFAMTYFMSGGGNAYSAHISLIEAMEMGLVWPWHFMEYVGLSA